MVGISDLKYSEYKAKELSFMINPWDLLFHIGYVLKFQEIYLINSGWKFCGRYI